MKKLSDKTKLAILQNISENFLTQPIPSNWEKLSSQERVSFIQEHVCEDYEDYDEYTLLEMITETSENLIFAIESGHIPLIEGNK